MGEFWVVMLVSSGLWAKIRLMARRLLPVLGATLALLLCLALPARASGTTVSYHVRIRPGEPGVVTAIVQGVSQSSVSLKILPEAWLTVPEEHFSGLTAQSQDNVYIGVLPTDDGWRVDTAGRDGFTFAYSFGIELKAIGATIRADQYACRVTDQGALFINSAVFLWPDVTVDAVSVTFDVPGDWTVGTSFVPGGNGTFKVGGAPSVTRELLDNITRMGVAEETVQQECDGITVTFIHFRGGYGEPVWQPGLGASLVDEMTDFVELYCRSIRFFRSLFGFWPGSSHYWISNWPTPAEVENFHWHRWGQVWPRSRWQQVPHHVLHIWVWHHEDAPIRGGGPEWFWLIEGVPTFNEARLTADLLDDDLWLGSFYVHHLITRRAEQFQLLDRHTINHYALGQMRALAMDRAIRDATKGKRSIDDLLALLGMRYGQSRQIFGREEVMAAANDVAGLDLSAFYQRHFAGRVSPELPPVDSFIDEYREPFFRWVDSLVQLPGSEAQGSRTMLLIALEMGIHSGSSPYAASYEHTIATRGGICNLEPFRARLSGLARPITEPDVIEALSAITDVDQSDFFDFYTVGGYRPSVREIQEWLGRFAETPGQPTSPPPTSQPPASISPTSPQPGAATPQPTPAPTPGPTQPAAASLSPSTIQIGVPTAVELVIRDERLVSNEGTTRLAVVARSDKMLGRMLKGAHGHYAVQNFEHQGVTTSFEVGYVPPKRTGETWTGKVTLTLPDDLVQIQLRATEESTQARDLAVTLIAPAAGPAEGSGSSSAETGKTGASAEPGGVTGAEAAAGRSAASSLAIVLGGVFAAAGLWWLLLRLRTRRRM